MKQIHPLLAGELFWGPILPADSRLIPTIPMQMGALFSLLSSTKDPVSRIENFVANAEAALKTATTAFQETLNLEDTPCVTGYASMVRHALNCIESIRMMIGGCASGALTLEQRVHVVVGVLSPMAWLDVFIKVLQFKEMHHQAT